MKYNKTTFGQVEAVFNKLGLKDGEVKNFLSETYFVIKKNDFGKLFILIEDADLSVRTYNFLKNNKINFLGDIVFFTESNFEEKIINAKCNFMGVDRKKIIEEIKDVLKIQKLKFSNI